MPKKWDFCGPPLEITVQMMGYMGVVPADVGAMSVDRGVVSADMGIVSDDTAAVLDDRGVGSAFVLAQAR